MRVTLNLITRLLVLTVCLMACEATFSKKPSGAELGSQLTPAPAAAEQPLVVRSGIEGISLKVKTCKRDLNDDVIITFTLENYSSHGAECQLRSGDSRAFDEEGSVYEGGDIISFAGKDGLFHDCYDAKLPKDIPVKYRMRIKNVDPDATVFRKVSIFMYELPIGSLTGSVYILNLPITRPGDNPDY